MTPKAGVLTTFKNISVSWFDFIVIGLLIIGGTYYLHDFIYWGLGWVGESAYGDAEFWWNGAIHIAEGIFKDNPGKGFRPGYFLLTGFTLPVLGMFFTQFYKFFLVVFLTTTSLFYLSLRNTLSRGVAACVCLMLVFNPYTAEWVATSTTDATGLLLNLLALSCLLFGINNNIKKSWLIGFGLFFSLATLTRPLVTPFIAIVIVTLALLPKEPLKNRSIMIFCILAAFLTPTSLWMTIQKNTIDQWSISSNDASAFYAASDPEIQVWQPNMYEHVEDLVKKNYRVNLKKIDSQTYNKLTNKVFWQETIKNYIQYPSYHLKRIAPHTWKIVNFSPKMSTHGLDHWRIGLFIFMLAGMNLISIMQRRWFLAFIYLAIGIGIYTEEWFLPVITLLGGSIALLHFRKLDTFFLATYWLTGIFALYLIGGTWGPPSFSPQFGFNALGYRLGSQFFFLNDILAAYFLVSLSHIRQFTPSIPFLQKISMFISQPSLVASKLVISYLSIFLGATTILYATGISLSIKHAYARSHIVTHYFPSTDHIAYLYKTYTKRPLLTANDSQGSLISNLEEDKDYIFTGIVSPFIWNLEGQKRAQIKVYPQNSLYPTVKTDRPVYLDIPSHLANQSWVGRQGVFIIRNLEDHHNTSNLPYYITHPTLIGFIPLSTNEKNYDLTKAIWFPLVKNATQLESSKELYSANSKISWQDTSGPAPYQRRFLLIPQLPNKKIQLFLTLKNEQAPLKLNFSYDTTSNMSMPSSNRAEDIEIWAFDKEKNKIPNLKFSLGTNQNTSLKQISLPIEKNTRQVEIDFNTTNNVWIYEFNLEQNNIKTMAERII